MRLVQIEKLENGAHRNQTIDSLTAIPEGWAVVPDDIVTDNFPFGDLSTEKVDGLMMVTSWTPGIIPEPEPEPEPIVREPSANELINIMLGVEDE
jgi:hypothetical protein